MVGVRSALGAALVLALCTHAHAFLVPTPAASLLPSAALSLRRPDAGHAGGMKMCSGGIARQESSFRSPPIDRRGVVGSVMLPVGLGALLQVLAPGEAWAKNAVAEEEVAEEEAVAEAVEAADALPEEAAEAVEAVVVEAADAAGVVTDRIFLDIKIQGVNSANKANEGRSSNLDAQAALEGRIVIGLFGEDAPETAAMFKAVAAGTLVVPCQEVIIEAAIAREALQKKQPIKQCKASEKKPVDLLDSSVWRIIKDKRVDFGRLKGKFLLRKAPESADANALTHDRPGMVSARKGGGQFEFSIAPAANSNLDKTNVVFGQVLEGGDILAKLNNTPVKQFAGGMGGGEDDATSTLAACYYGSKNSFCGANKPLQRVIVQRAGVL
ncbi:hypothetical protein T484DRAFT_1927930 [Baffinella frigidus]|nr:hypothetical protein T484DRAFT_1927930 [Cryptophyta sp. CCMP2293]